jgi:serine protease inhibitor
MAQLNRNFTRRETQNNNDRINNRGMMDIQIINRKKRDEINRLDIERDEFLRQSNNSRNEDINEAPSRDFGEFRNPGISYDRGMPMRSNVEFKGNSNFNQPNDFDVFMNSGGLNNSRNLGKSVSSFERSTNNYADIDVDTKLTEQVQDKSICVSGINNYGLFLLQNLLRIMKQPFVSSPILIYSIFSAIYLGSEGNTNVELKNYFNFPRNDVLHSGINYLLDLFTSTQISFGNCIIFADNIEHNQEFCKYINNLTKIRKVNSTNAEREAENINNIIIHSTSPHMKKSIIKDNIYNCDVLCLSYASIEPIWYSEFYKVVPDIFNSEYLGRLETKFMIASNQTFGYYDTPYYQVLEIAAQNNIAFGIILGNIDLNQKIYDRIILNLKPTILDEVKIPMFKIQTKVRYTNILKETDLKTIFLDLNVPELFTSTCKLDDVIQNIEIKITNKFISKKINNKNIKTVKKFQAISTFIYYLRQTDTNTLLFIGSY